MPTRSDSVGKIGPERAPRFNGRGGRFYPPYNSTDTDALCLIAAVKNRLPPTALVQIPSDGLLDPGLEGLGGAPAQLALDLCCIDRVAAVMTGPVGDERDQTLARAQIGRVMSI